VSVGRPTLWASLLGASLLLCTARAQTPPAYAAQACVRGPTSLTRVRTCLRRAYPDAIERVEENRVLFRDGSSLPLDDGQTKEPVHQLLREADIQDQFTYRYLAHPPSPGQPCPHEDPGRVRAAPLFEKLYGSSPAEVERHLTSVVWSEPSGARLRVTTLHGVAAALARVVHALRAAPPAVRTLVGNVSGGYAWRTVRGAEQRSAHAYGIAVDVASTVADYWLWAPTARVAAQPQALHYRNRVPLDVVTAFEREGFIWGGKWYHYDTMHFEYRPELLCAARE
jgi:D-alanyl-D-alanine carboxypeptidase